MRGMPFCFFVVVVAGLFNNKVGEKNFKFRGILMQIKSEKCVYGN